jgi:hypothetical protein
VLIDWDDLAGDLRGAPSVREEIDEDADLRIRAERTVKQIVQSSGGNLSEAAPKQIEGRSASQQEFRHRQVHRNTSRVAQSWAGANSGATMSEWMLSITGRISTQI